MGVINDNCMKGLLTLVIGLVAILSNAQNQNVTAADTLFYKPQLASLLDLVDTNRILSDVRVLSSIYSRDVRHPGNDTAAIFIADKMQQYNVSIIQQEYYFEFDTLAPNVNVIGIKTGEQYPDSFIIVSAHFDSYSNSENAPGTDDNASGVAGMLEILRIIDTVKTKYSIMFCAFNAEEWGWQGSTMFVDSAIANGLAIKFDLNIDMIGYSNPVDSHYIVLCTGFSYNYLAEKYRDVAAMYVPLLSIPGNFSNAYYYSDQKSFIDNYIPALSFYENYFDNNPFIHTAADTIGAGFNSLTNAKLITQANLAFIIEFAGINAYTDIEKHEMPEVKISPNPVVDGFFIKGIKSGTRWSVVDVSGRIVMQGFQNNKVVDVSTLIPGVYLMKTENSQCYFIKAN